MKVIKFDGTKRVYIFEDGKEISADHQGAVYNKRHDIKDVPQEKKGKKKK